MPAGYPDAPLEPVRPVLVGGMDPGVPARAAAARWQRSVAVQPPAAGNPHNRPVTYADGYHNEVEQPHADTYGAGDMITAADVGTDTTLPYLGDLSIGPSDDNQPPTVGG